MNYLAKELEAHAEISPKQRQYWVEQGLLLKDSKAGIHHRAYTGWMMFRAALIAHVIKRTPITKYMAQAFVDIFESTINTDLLDEKDFIDGLALMLLFNKKRTSTKNKKNERWYDLIILGPRSAWASMTQEKIYVFQLEQFWPAKTIMATQKDKASWQMK